MLPTPAFETAFADQWGHRGPHFDSRGPDFSTKSNPARKAANDVLGLGRTMLEGSDVLIIVSNYTRLISRDIPTRQYTICTRLADAWVAPCGALLQGHAAIGCGWTQLTPL
ncbi:hypothetical protein GW17_00059548 [Ensete ventricosum]|nr:hypothetical protein GW17_00059548 [Ensete ventricosum]RZS21848.1 hypothetical protein BHM03_00054540 [Ensete ventricosum]